MKVTCPDSDCAAENHAYLDRCVECGADLGFPNVRTAETDVERAALDKRHRVATEDARKRGVADQLIRLEERLNDSHAVINIDRRTLLNLLTSPKTLYANYHALIAAGVRLPSAPEDDQQRRAVDGRLFGQYADKISFAALSLGGRGLVSYGDHTMVLKETSVRRRASVLEHNSFDLMELPYFMRDGCPVGKRAGWAGRGKLAATKLAPRIEPDTDEADFPDMLLRSDGDRANDEFMEVHIFGAFSMASVEKVIGPAPPSLGTGRRKKRKAAPSSGAADAAAVKEAVEMANIAWEDA